MELWILRLVHITTGIYWAGTAITAGLFLIPAIREAGPSGGAVMAALAGRKFPVVLNVVALFTVLTGLRLYAIYMGPAWLSSTTGILLSVGGFLGTSAFIFGTLVQRPAAMKLAKLAGELRQSGGPPSPEQAEQLERVQKRLGTAAKHNAFLLLATAIRMAASRFVPF